MKKIVLTGASGRLGSYLREPLCNRAKKLLSTDINENIGTLYPREEFVKADLSNFADEEVVVEYVTSMVEPSNSPREI